MLNIVNRKSVLDILEVLDLPLPLNLTAEKLTSWTKKLYFYITVTCKFTLLLICISFEIKYKLKNKKKKTAIVSNC